EGGRDGGGGKGGGQEAHGLMAGRGHEQIRGDGGGAADGGRAVSAEGARGGDDQAGQGRDRERSRERAGQQLEVRPVGRGRPDQPLVLVPRLLVEGEVAEEGLRAQDGVGR